MHIMCSTHVNVHEGVSLLQPVERRNAHFTWDRRFSFWVPSSGLWCRRMHMRPWRPRKQRCTTRSLGRRGFYCKGFRSSGTARVQTYLSGIGSWTPRPPSEGQGNGSPRNRPLTRKSLGDNRIRQQWLLLSQPFTSAIQLLAWPLVPGQTDGPHVWNGARRLGKLEYCDVKILISYDKRISSPWGANAVQPIFDITCPTKTVRHLKFAYNLLWRGRFKFHETSCVSVSLRSQQHNGWAQAGPGPSPPGLRDDYAGTHAVS